jgi:signal recognition particle subunit SRP54
MGSLESILGMIPGFSKMAKAAGGFDFDGKELVKTEAIINSMTPKERVNTAIINGSRRLRIAKGSGTTVQEVNHLLKQYAQARKMMKRFTQMGEKGFRRGGMPFFS